MIQPLFFLVRHGRTPNNDRNEYRGWDKGPDSQLSPEGRDDIRKAGIFLKTTGYEFPLVISDSLPRAKESGEIIAGILGIKVQHIDDRARTIDVGDLTGKNKDDYPLTTYCEHPSKKIPGGESFNNFNKRMAAFFSDVIEMSKKVGRPPVVISHGAVSAFLYNHFNRKGEKAGYEGLTNPGGVLVFTKDGIIPLTQKRGEAAVPYKDGTAMSGFVTEEESHLPRACWNCRWSQRDINYLLGCTHLVIRLDPKLMARRQADGTVAVKDNECSDFFQNKVST